VTSQLSLHVLALILSLLELLQHLLSFIVRLNIFFLNSIRSLLHFLRRGVILRTDRTILRALDHPVCLCFFPFLFLNFLLQTSSDLQTLAHNSIKTPAEPKVCDLDRAVLIDQHVSRLEVSVHNVGWMQILKSAQKIVNDGRDVFLLEIYCWLNDLLQVTLLKVENKVDSSEVGGVLGLYQVEQTDNVLVLNLMQNVNLAHYAFTVYLIFEDVFHLLDRDLLACWPIYSWCNSSVCAWPQEFNEFVVWPNFPVLEFVDI